MEWCEVSPTFDIIFSDRKEFNIVLDWDEIKGDIWGVVDIGHSDMIIKFEDEEMRDSVCGAIIMSNMTSVETRNNNP